MVTSGLLAPLLSMFGGEDAITLPGRRPAPGSRHPRLELGAGASDACPSPAPQVVGGDSSGALGRRAQPAAGPWPAGAPDPPGSAGSPASGPLPGWAEKGSWAPPAPAFAPAAFPQARDDPRDPRPPGLGLLPGAPRSWAEAVALVEASLGAALLAAAAAAVLGGAPRAAGAALGLLLAALGAGGWRAARARLGPRAASLYAVCAVAALVLTADFLTAVRRGAEVDCAIASLWDRARALEAQAARGAHSEAVAQLVARVGEVESSLDLVRKGALEASALAAGRNADRAFLRGKLAELRRHAEEVVGEMLSRDTRVGDLSPAQRQELIARFTAAEDLLARIEGAHASPAEDLTYDEYRELLEALSGLHEAGGAGAGGGSGETGAGREPEAAQQGLRARRRRWDQRLRGYLGEARAAEADAAALAAAAPGRCEEELRDRGWLTGLGVAALAAQLAGAYATLSAAVGGGLAAAGKRWD